MRRVLLDQGLAPRAAALLRAEGWDALHVIEAGLDHAQDGEILAFALAENRVCVTLDHDFHVHLALAKAVAPSVPRRWGGSIEKLLCTSQRSISFRHET